jgi:hypothetical protein
VLFLWFCRPLKRALVCLWSFPRAYARGWVLPCAERAGWFGHIGRLFWDGPPTEAPLERSELLEGRRGPSTRAYALAQDDTCFLSESLPGTMRPFNDKRLKLIWGKRGVGNKRCRAAEVRLSTTRAGNPQESLWMECGGGARRGVIPVAAGFMVCQAQSNALMNRVPKTAKWQFQSELDGFSTFPS